MFVNMENIASLVEKGLFETLSSAEQQQVLAQMTAARFDQLHQALQQARTLDAEVTPPADLGLRLQQRMATLIHHAPQVSFFHRLASWRMPVWQAAAAAAMLVFAVYKYGNTETVVPAPPLVQTLIKTDTVFLEKVQWKERIVWRERPEKVTEPAANPAVATVATHAVFPENRLPELPLEISSAGAPIGAQPELLQFFTQPGSK